MRNNDLRVGFQPRLDSSRFPVPEHDVTAAVPTTDPPSIGRKPDLARKSSDRMARESFLAVLPEIVGAIYENLVVKGLRCKVFLGGM